MEASAKTVVAPGRCVIDETREELRRHWRSSEEAPRPVRLALAQTTRLIAEIALGRGSPALLRAIEAQGLRLIELDPVAAQILSSSLAEFHDEWTRHAVKSVCSAGTCFQQPNVAPCRAACPANIDIPGFLAHIGNGDYDDALRVIAKDNPLPYSCGLVCPAPCEKACLRGATGAPLFIRPLKAVAAAEGEVYVPPKRTAPTGKRVAVVGSGPAGLTTAYYLAGLGHRVEIFEARQLAGGMMRYGIPNYRLPPAVLNAEIDHIKSQGVVIHTDCVIQSVEDVRARGFDAMYLALGLQLSKSLNIPGDDLPFVWGGMDFLGNVAAGKNPRVGPRVVVVGAGNSAVDAAMTALRQGAQHVSMVYRGRRREMRASPHEIALAEAEGVEILELWTPERVLPDHKMIFSRSPKATEAELQASGPLLTLEVDQVLSGIGQRSSLSCLAGCRVQIEQGHIVVDPVSAATAEPGVFAGGDVAHGASTVVAAVRAGKTAAAAIDAFLTGTRFVVPAATPAYLDAVPPPVTDAAQRSHKQRPIMPERDALERRTTYQQIELGLAEADARAEANRCLRCDICIGCGLCELVCSEVGAEALRMVETSAGRRIFDDFTRPISRCVGCGACAEICPTGAIHIEDRDGWRSTIITGTVVRRQTLRSCDACQQNYVTEVQFDRIQDQGHGAPHLCPACARMANAARSDQVRWP